MQQIQKIPRPCHFNYANYPWRGQQPYYQYILAERALLTMNFDTSIIKIGWKKAMLWAFKEFNMANIKPLFWIFN